MNALMEHSLSRHNSNWNSLMEVRRKGVTERTIFGSIGLCTGQKSITLHGADPLIYGRSLMKPLQMKAIACELDKVLDWREKAIALASHSGTDVHIEAAQGILPPQEWRFLALPESAPLGVGTSAKVRSIWHNPCSGKHSAILRACERNGWPMTGYTEISHPYNQAFVKTLERNLGKSLAGRTVAPDGCLLPTVAMSVAEIARLFASLAKERNEDWIWEAAHAHPDLVGGEGRMDTTILQQFPDILAKEGADGLLGLAIADDSRFPDGFGLVIKLAHGYDPAVTWHIAFALLSELDYNMRKEPTPLSGQTIHMEDLLGRFQMALAAGL
jgi:L-asparaginase